MLHISKATCRYWQVGVRRFSAPAATPGLFGLAGLHLPEDWRRLTGDSIQRCEGIISDIVSTASSEDTVPLLDTVSDVICQAYDAAEFCRNVHTDPAWQREAQAACISLGDYVARLNLHNPLYNSLVRALEQQERRDSHAAATTNNHTAARTSTKEEALVGRLLRHDFEKSGIHLPEQTRERLLQLRGQEQQLGFQMGQNLKDGSKAGFVEVDKRKTRVWDGLPWTIQRTAQPVSGVASRGSSVHLPLDTANLNRILRWAPDAPLRQQAFIAGYSGPAENLGLLDQLIQVRREIAQLLGAPSFADYQLRSGTLAATPAAVTTFLEDLATAARPKAEEELAVLERWGGRAASTWDRQYQMGEAKANLIGIGGQAVSEYFPLQGCVKGLQSIAQQCLGVTLAPTPMLPGEGWANDVLKMEVQHEDEGVLGHFYMDLHPRPGKYQHAAQFTLRCGRQLSDGSYQTPLVALVLNFDGGRGAQLSHHEAITFFHEAGHALHSLLSRTRFQHLSGTRGALDIVEIASHLMEHFVHDPRSLRLFARHKTTGDAMPEAMVTKLLQTQRVFGALDLQQQILYALLDQHYHGRDPPPPGGTTQRLAALAQRFSLYPVVPGTHPQVRLGHLVGYGGCYYSYLYAASLASSLWEKCFVDDPLSRDAGDHFCKELLEVGSAKEPLELVQGLLGSGAVRAQGGGWAPDIQALLKPLGIADA